MFADPRVTKQGQDSYHVTYGDDTGLYVEFECEAIEDEEKTISEGRPFYKNIDFITIRIAGDKNTVVKRPVRLYPDAGVPADDKRFPRQWEAFKNKQKVVEDGTPITEWSLVDKSTAMMLKGVNVHTVEQLATVSDANLNWHGARTLRDKAVAWLEQSKKNAGISKLMDENEKLKADVEAMKNQLKALADRALQETKEPDVVITGSKIKGGK
jgi:hypothetical protein